MPSGGLRVFHGSARHSSSSTSRSSPPCRSRAPRNHASRSERLPKTRLLQYSPLQPDRAEQRRTPPANNKGKRFQAFAAHARGLVVDCQYILPCPHSPANANVCTIRGCKGVNYSSEVVRDVLLSGIFDQDIKRKLLGDSTLESKTLNELVRFVENKEAMRGEVAKLQH